MNKKKITSFIKNCYLIKNRIYHKWFIIKPPFSKAYNWLNEFKVNVAIIRSKKPSHKNHCEIITNYLSRSASHISRTNVSKYMLLICLQKRGGRWGVWFWLFKWFFFTILPANRWSSLTDWFLHDYQWVNYFMHTDFQKTFLSYIHKNVYYMCIFFCPVLVWLFFWCSRQLS